MDTPLRGKVIPGGVRRGARGNELGFDAELATNGAAAGAGGNMDWHRGQDVSPVHVYEYQV